MSNGRERLVAVQRSRQSPDESAIRVRVSKPVYRRRREAGGSPPETGERRACERWAAVRGAPVRMGSAARSRSVRKDFSLANDIRMICSMGGKSRIDELVEENLDLAQIIAFDYGHIPGITLSDAVSEAQNALHRAVIGFTPGKGPPERYAAKAIRNALNSLYRKQVRIAKMFPKSLDCESRSDIAGYGSGESPVARVADAKTNILLEIPGRESDQALEAVLRSLSPRERLVIESIKHGSSLQQIG
jgi:RNA polymerase sigma factor (sigma-70 family)